MDSNGVWASNSSDSCEQQIKHACEAERAVLCKLSPPNLDSPLILLSSEYLTQRRNL